MLVERQRRTGEAVRSSCGRAAGGIDEDDLLGTCGAEELSEHHESTLSGLGRAGLESFEIVHVGQCSVLLAALAG
ncbi:hypothetical protein [Streptomyces sp. NPDC029003]|uniref:hypothetical protein n=1 Tax=Streptomyces sp. NPDC029003 TaxID=3155125 RepID=UPI003403D968